MNQKKAKTRKQIADEYGISRKTFQRWRKKENIKLSNGLITPKELDEIYEIFGKPK
jgi:predicted site-specific integrase-resolvase